MERPHLTPKQAEALRDRIWPMLHFVGRCRRRLEALGFDQKGPIYQAINKTYSALHELHMNLHYESCGHGVGRASAERSEQSHPTDRAQAPPSRPDA
jgi:hypothetical protein